MAAFFLQRIFHRFLAFLFYLKFEFIYEQNKIYLNPLLILLLLTYELSFDCVKIEPLKHGEDIVVSFCC